MTRPSRISRAAILSQLRQAATKGDRSALTLAIVSLVLSFVCGSVQ